ncbi:MAG: response regulator [Patescibacteria group bacterium]
MGKSPQKTVLIVEDEPHVLKMISSKLYHEGLGVLEAKNGEEGLKLAVQNHPDLIVSDIVMPKMDGLTMIKKIRQNGWGKTVPIILITNLKEENSFKKNIEEHNLSFYFNKPNWKLQDVANKVKEVLKI